VTWDSGEMSRKNLFLITAIYSSVFQIPDLWKSVILPKLPPEITLQEKDNLKGITHCRDNTQQSTTNFVLTLI
jgi:hypothetical protein